MGASVNQTWPKGIHIHFFFLTLGYQTTMAVDQIQPPAGGGELVNFTWTEKKSNQSPSHLGSSTASLLQPSCPQPSCQHSRSYLISLTGVLLPRSWFCFCSAGPRSHLVSPAQLRSHSLLQAPLNSRILMVSITKSMWSLHVAALLLLWRKWSSAPPLSPR